MPTSPLPYHRLTVVMPAHNEAATVGGVVCALRSHPVLAAARIVVVDNASTDATAMTARQAGADVIHEPRKGYGAACLAGTHAADPGSVVLLMDADGSDDLDGAAQVAAEALAGGADLVMGSRTRGIAARGALTPQQRMGNAIAARALRAWYGLRVSDIGPTRAIHRETLLRLGMREMTYGWSTEMLAKAARAGLRVREIPVNYHQRQGGRSKVAGTVRGTLGASVAILRTLARYRRWRPRRQALAIVARVPVPGQTKTRLGQVIGHDAATRLYAAFLADLSARFTEAAALDGYDLYWLMAPGENSTFPFTGDNLIWQEGADFAARLYNGLHALALRGYERVAVIGSDSPHIPAHRVAEAFAALESSPVAIGPATDGGYYLLGARTASGMPDLFTGIQMSTATVRAETVRRATELGLGVAELPTTFDVDEAHDLTTLRQALATAPSAAADPCPATLEALRAILIAPTPAWVSQ